LPKEIIGRFFLVDSCVSQEMVMYWFIWVGLLM
jgi:hypothetical protein